MKKLFLGLIISLVTVIILPVQALATEMVAMFKIGEASFYLQAQKQEMDVAPFIEGGRCYVPVRYLAHSIGISDQDIHWDPATSKVTLSKGDITLEMTAGSQAITANGVSWEVDAAPLIREGRVFLPARDVVSRFGYTVSWNDQNKVVSVNQADVLRPKTYTDTQNRFSLEYPENWTVKITDAGFQFCAPIEDCNDVFTESVVISRLTGFDGVEMNDLFVASFLEGEKTAFTTFEVMKKTDGSLAGLPAVSIDFKASNDDNKVFYVNQVLVIKDGKLFSLSFMSNIQEKIQGQYAVQFNIIKSSFKPLG